MFPRTRTLLVASLVALFACSTSGSSDPDPTTGDTTDAGTGDTTDAGTGAATGAPCTAASACAGTTPICLATDATGLAHPGGYCSSACDAAKNDPSDATNRDCPNRNTCVLAGGQSLCRAACTAKDGEVPCRDGYVCSMTAAGAPVCLPATAFCDPATPTSCGSGKVCITAASVDPVGACVTACDPLLQNCATGEGCYANESGSGFCLPAGDRGDQAQCDYLSQCAPGWACRAVGGAPRCRKYCGGSNNVACANERPCVDFTPSVTKDVLGQCE